MTPLTSSPLTIEKTLLGLLRGQPAHGYELHQRLSEQAGIGRVWHVKQSHVYALLSKLEDRGFIESTLEEQGARPPRKVFHLTREGRSAFREWVQAPVQHGRQFRLEFLAKLYFACQEGDAVAHTLLRRQRETCHDWLSDQAEEAQELQHERPYDWLVHEFRAGQIESMLEWLDTCEETLLSGGTDTR